MNDPGPSRLPSSSPSCDNFPALSADDLPHVLQKRNVLILDIRPHSAYKVARLPHAISLSVPSTLLKRPAFSLSKLSSMLASNSAKARFNAWSSASRILVYDAESTSLNQSSNLLGLLRKFRADGFKGDIAWLHGGLQALWRTHRYLVDEGPPSDDEDEADDSGFVRARDMPLSAFQRSSTTTANSRMIPNASPRSAQTLFGQRTAGLSSPPRRSAPPLRLDQSQTFAAANPFYDNIRQNVELSQGITERIPLILSPEVTARIKDLPFSWLRDIAKWAGQDASTDALAMQFYRIELKEQRRMHSVMTYHSCQSGNQDGEPRFYDENTAFPYSITAGIEKGEKNRYVEEHDHYARSNLSPSQIP
jgi:protein-tyrosine phosphatase